MDSLYADIWKEKLELFAILDWDQLGFQDFQILEITAQKKSSSWFVLPYSESQSRAQKEHQFWFSIDGG